MPVPIVMYSATDCDDSERAREHLRARQITFDEINIDHAPDAEHFVRVANRGYRSTPTLIIGSGKARLLLTEPTNAELDAALSKTEWL